MIRVPENENCVIGCAAPVTVIVLICEGVAGAVTSGMGRSDVVTIGWISERAISLFTIGAPWLQACRISPDLAVVAAEVE